MNRIALCLSTLSLAACGGLLPSQGPKVDDQARPNLPGDADVSSIVDEFYSKADSLKHALTHDTREIKFVDSLASQGDSVIGVCITYTQGDVEVYRELELLSSFWSTASLQSRHTLLFHELGHCALDLNHVPEGSGAIMEPIILNDSFAQSNWPSLVSNEFQASTLTLLDVPSEDFVTRTAK